MFCQFIKDLTDSNQKGTRRNIFYIVILLWKYYHINLWYHPTFHFVTSDYPLHFRAWRVQQLKPYIHYIPRCLFSRFLLRMQITELQLAPSNTETVQWSQKYETFLNMSHLYILSRFSPVEYQKIAQARRVLVKPDHVSPPTIHQDVIPPEIHWISNNKSHCIF